MEDKYTITIFWSEEDHAYIAQVEELAGCSAFADTREEALNEAKLAIKIWLEVARKYNDKIPQPKDHRRVPIQAIARERLYVYQ